jgi:hypothetical protein
MYLVVQYMNVMDETTKQLAMEHGVVSKISLSCLFAVFFAQQNLSGSWGGNYWGYPISLIRHKMNMNHLLLFSCYNFEATKLT